MIIAVAAEKGGVGKTATAVHLAVGLARKDRKVLLVDLDSQGHASFYVGHTERDATAFVDALLDQAPLKPVATEYDVDLLEGGRSLALLKTELTTMHNPQTLLRDALRPLKNTYDLIIIDTPPELGLTTINALVASDAVIIPVQCHGAALHGMDDLMETIKEVRDELNGVLQVVGVIPTMAQHNTLMAQNVLEHLNTHYEGLVTPSVRYSIVMAESYTQATPIYTYDPKNNASRDYKKVCAWIEEKI